MQGIFEEFCSQIIIELQLCKFFENAYIHFEVNSVLLILLMLTCQPPMFSVIKQKNSNTLLLQKKMATFLTLKLKLL